ncbi:DUF4286 family protein [Actinomadura sp. WMMB 499]|uniref:DUF4286 family protein n=1 Tax=Actinomadura sp. WMMB 499 TaxID=1219491 RepID=UPI00124742DA|nr:DUF4286 family protein [Actinomadura sp. WMMB 499]QFG20734.1 hypothetical protein F7P10_05800 [Actinomadura sp. WMMB 499]
MPKRTILHVESGPAGPDVADEYNRWYDEVHIPEMLAIEGVVAARRYAPLDGDTYVAHYEIEGDPKDVMKRLQDAARDGTMHLSDTARKDPPARMLLMELVAERDAASG